MILMQHQLTKSSTPTTSLPVSPNPSTTGPLQLPLIHHPSTSADDRHSAAALEVIHNARKILGFSPITPDDISYLKAQNNMNDNTEAMSVAIIEFLNCEMKVPKSFTDQLIMKRIFPPSRHPTEWKTLYVEFEEESSVHYIYSYVRNLCKGINLHIYIPHSFFDRFEAIDSIAYKIRKGPGDFKTRIQYGTNDLILYKKSPSDLSWNIVPLEDLPPLNLEPPQPQSNSPPLGRPRTLKRKERSPLHDSCKKRSKSSSSPSNVSEETPSNAGKDDQEKKDEPTETAKDSLN